MPWDVVYIQEGLPPHQQTYNSWFLGSDTVFGNAVPVEAVVFNLNETAGLSTDWKMYLRAKLTRKDALQAEGAIFNLGVHMGFQFEVRDNLVQQFLLSDYTNPDPHYGSTFGPWTVSSIMSDIMLISEQFWWPLGWNVWGGSGTHQLASDYDDVVNNRYYGLGTTLNPDSWVIFGIPLKQRIEEVFADVQIYINQMAGEIWDFTLTSLILRNIALYIEGVNVDIEAEVDHVWFSSAYQNDADTGGDAGNSFYTATSTSPGSAFTGELYPPDDTNDWYKFYASSGQSILVTMTPPAGHDYDLELYSPDDALKAWSYLGVGSTDAISYTADSSGDWRIRICIFTGIGPYTFYVSVITPPPPPPPDGGGGCPYVSVWDGAGWRVDNNLIPAAEYSNGSDVTDYCLLQQPLARDNGKHSLLVWDLDKHSFLDQLQLMAVDHESDLEVAVSPSGEILTYRDPAPTTKALSKAGENVSDLLLAPDGQSYKGYSGDYILLDFDGADIQDGAKLVIRSDLPCLRPCIKSPVYVQIFNSTGAWQTISTIYTRLYWATDIIDLSEHLPDANGELKVRIVFTSYDKIDFIGLDTSKQGEFETHYVNMASAVHSNGTDMKEALRYSDDLYVELMPGEEVKLDFTLAQSTQERRDFIIILEGHYFLVC